MIHEARVSLNTSWVTPKWIFDWVGSFDLDPATFDGHPWPCAIENRTIDGLLQPWHGRVFLNPPYESRQIEPFMERMAEHRHGVAVVACRIETEWFQRYVFGAAQAVFFPRGRIRFCNPQGEEMRAVAFPSCVVFYEPPPATAPRPGVWWFARTAADAAMPANSAMDRTPPQQGVGGMPNQRAKHDKETK
jgi:hypothetical protein